jgi:hypothetical protein
MKAFTLKVALNSKFVGFSLGIASDGGVPRGFGMGFAVPRLGDNIYSYVGRTLEAMEVLCQRGEIGTDMRCRNFLNTEQRYSNRDPVTGRFVARM